MSDTSEQPKRRFGRRTAKINPHARFDYPPKPTDSPASGKTTPATSNPDAGRASLYSPEERLSVLSLLEMNSPLRVCELAVLMHCSVQVARRLVRNGTIPSMKIEGMIRLKAIDVKRYFSI